MISPSEAKAALGEVTRVQQRTTLAAGYSLASPYLILSGMVWLAGYAAMGLTAPEHWATVWIALWFVTAIGCFALGRRSRRAGRSPAAGGMFLAVRSIALALSCMAFILATFLLFKPEGLLPYLVFPALVMAFIYALIGGLGMFRFVWIGAGVFVVTVAGLVLMPQAIAFWVGAAGGGGLVFGGLWLRKA
jgi:hypothetical protein